VLSTGCVAPAQSIGAVDESVAQTTSGDEASTAVDPGTSTGSVDVSGSGSSTTSAALCDPECVAFHECQQARCVDGECVISFRDALCEPGQSCGPAGCEATPLACDDPAVLVCEGFENDAFAPQWVGGAIERVFDETNSGAAAGRVSVEPDEREQLDLELDPPLDDGMLAIRSFIRIPSSDFVEEWVILYEIFGRTNAGTERYSVDLRPQAGLMFVSLPEGTVFGNDLLVPETWMCVEVRIQLSQGQGEVELRVDDVPVLTNGPGLDTIPVDGIANIDIGGIGAPSHSGQSAFLIDDIVVATAPIGCDVD